MCRIELATNTITAESKIGIHNAVTGTIFPPLNAPEPQGQPRNLAKPTPGWCASQARGDPINSTSPLFRCSGHLALRSHSAAICFSQPFAMEPTTPAPRINHTEFILKRNIVTILTTKIETVSQSVIEAFPNCQATTAIKASDATTTPSNTAPAKGERRIFGIRGPLTATKAKPGTKIPRVA